MTRNSPKIDIAIGRGKPKSCAEGYISPLEKPSDTKTGAIRAAFTLNYMLARSGDDSCEFWPARAAKARFDRYCNMMTLSLLLTVPDTVRDSYLREAKNSPTATSAIKQCSDTATQRLAIQLQNDVLLAQRNGDALDAFTASQILVATANESEWKGGISSQIREDVLIKQTAYLRDKAVKSDGEAAVASRVSDVMTAPN